MSCRKNWVRLTDDEKQRFVDAVLVLKNTTPSVLFPGVPNRHRYDDYVELHRRTMAVMPSWGHMAPAFFSWHRELLRHFEQDLQSIDASVSIPYWDWTVDNSPTSPIWDATYLGTDGRPSDGKVMDGAFASDGGNWTIRIKDSAGDPNFLERAFGQIPDTPDLPTPGEQTTTLNWSVYDLFPWDDMERDPPDVDIAQWQAFRIFGEIVLHNTVHRWVNGTMMQACSPNDPVFWLHHCNIDRLWSVWQRQHPGSSFYLPASGAPDGHNAGDALIFVDPDDPAAIQPWPGATTTSTAVINHHTMPDGYWYDTDPPEVISQTNSIAFTDIQQGVGGIGVTTYRAVVLEVVPGHCNDITFEITAGPTAGFATPLGTTTTIPASESAVPVKGRLWISYNTTSGDIAGGSVTVRATARDSAANTVWTDTWTVTLSATTVARQKSAVALVLDRSGSMTDDAGDGTQKIEKLREAVEIFVEVMKDGDGLGVVRFDHEADRLMDVVNVGPLPAAPGSGRQQIADILASHDPATTLDPRGATSVGGGMAEGKLVLEDAASEVPPYVVRAMLVLTDGNENVPPWIAGVDMTGVADHVFAIGFGTASNVSAPKLNEVTQNNGGYLVVTGAITESESFRLSKYFLQIQAGINNQDVVLDPQGQLVFGATHRIPFSMTEADAGMDVILLGPAPYYVDFQLETPDGQLISPGSTGAEPAIEFVSRPRVSYYRISLPALAASPTGSHTGRWHAVLSLRAEAQRADDKLLRRLKGRALPYSLLVHSHSNLRLKANVHQRSFEPGAEVLVLAYMSEYDVPVERRARVWAEVTRPDGGEVTIQLAESDAGRFEGRFKAASAGVYSLRLRASGSTFYGSTFQREQTLSVAVFPGGDRPTERPSDDFGDLPGGGRGCLCRLLHCLLVIIRECARMCLKDRKERERREPRPAAPHDHATGHAPMHEHPVVAPEAPTQLAELQQAEPRRRTKRVPSDMPLFPTLKGMQEMLAGGHHHGGGGEQGGGGHGGEHGGEHGGGQGGGQSGGQSGHSGGHSGGQGGGHSHGSGGHAHGTGVQPHDHGEEEDDARDV